MARKVIGSLKAILREAQLQGLVAHNAAEAIKIKGAGRGRKHPKVGVDVPRPEEVGAMIANADMRWRASTLCATRMIKPSSLN